jgi:prefoldin subunit 5
MPRGVKGSGKAAQTKSVSERITEIESQIRDYKERISSLQKSKRELYAAKEKEGAERLLKTVLDSGISIEQAISAITDIQKP